MFILSLMDLNDKLCGLLHRVPENFFSNVTWGLQLYSCPTLIYAVISINVGVLF